MRPDPVGFTMVYRPKLQLALQCPESPFNIMELFPEFPLNNVTTSPNDTYKLEIICINTEKMNKMKF